MEATQVLRYLQSTWLPYSHSEIIVWLGAADAVCPSRTGRVCPSRTGRVYPSRMGRVCPSRTAGLIQCDQ